MIEMVVEIIKGRFSLINDFLNFPSYEPSIVVS